MQTGIAYLRHRHLITKGISSKMVTWLPMYELYIQHNLQKQSNSKDYPRT